MSCSFISVLRQLSNLSCDAVANVDSFGELKKYLHVRRSPENALRNLLLRTETVSHKQLILLCGSAGDGKSHLLSHLKNEEHLLDNYIVINDANETRAVLTREIPEQDRSLITVPKELRRVYPNVQPEYMQKALERCREQQCPEDEATISWYGKMLAAVIIDETIGKRGGKHEHP